MSCVCMYAISRETPEELEQMYAFLLYLFCLMHVYDINIALLRTVGNNRLAVNCS